MLCSGLLKTILLKSYKYKRKSINEVKTKQILEKHREEKVEQLINDFAQC